MGTVTRHPVLDAEIRQGLPKLTNRVIQTTDLFGFVTMSDLCVQYRGPCDGSHGALRDAEMLADCYLKYVHSTSRARPSWAPSGGGGTYHLPQQPATPYPRRSGMTPASARAPAARPTWQDADPETLTPLQRQVLAQLMEQEKSKGQAGQQP